VWWRDWPLRRPDAPPDRPTLVAEAHEVIAANDLARALGVEPGMRRREGEALCPHGVILDRDVGREVSTFEPMISAIEELIPRVEVAEPGLLFVEVSGALRYYGGEDVATDLVLKAVSPLSGVAPVRVGVANGPFASRLAASQAPPGEALHIDDDYAYLAQQDVAAIGNRDLVATFRWLGVTTLGELAQLPREAIASRFGHVGLTAHRLASGEDRPAAPRQVPVDATVERVFEEPLIMMDQVGFAARAMSVELIGGLCRYGAAAHRIEVEAVTEDGASRHRVWRSANPFTEDMLADRVWWQLRAWVERGGVTSGIVRLRLSPADVSGDGRQLSFLEDTVAKVEAERALARVQALVGPDQVLVAQPRGGRDPGDRVEWRRWGEPTDFTPSSAPWPGATPSPSPALVPRQPTQIEVEWDGGMPARVRLRSRWVQVVSWAGPWRKTGRWWKDELDVDRYQIVTSVGAFLCEVKANQTFVIGVYD